MVFSAEINGNLLFCKVIFFLGSWRQQSRAVAWCLDLCLPTVMTDKELADAARPLSRVALQLSSTPMTTVSNTLASDGSASLPSV